MRPRNSATYPAKRSAPDRSFHHQRHHQEGLEDEPVVDDLLIAAQYAHSSASSSFTPIAGGRNNDDGCRSLHPAAAEPAVAAPPTPGTLQRDDADHNNKHARTVDGMVMEDDDNEICLDDEDGSDEQPVEGDAASCSKERQRDTAEPVSSTASAGAPGMVAEETIPQDPREERIDPAVTAHDPSTTLREEPSATIDGADNITKSNQPEQYSGTTQKGKDGDDENVMDDDDESTVDLEAELARMTTTEADEEDEGIGGPASVAQPKTAHEVDLVDPAPKNDAVRVVPLTEEWLPRFHSAGTLQHVLPDDTFTIVIVQANPNLLLEEGSVVWIHRVGEDATGAWAVALGRIVEVFGPVRQPLYHVRLPKLPLQSSLPVGTSKAPPQPTPSDGLPTLDPLPLSSPYTRPHGPLQPEPPKKPPNSDPQVVSEPSLPTNALPQPTAPDDPPNTEPPTDPAPPVPVVGIPPPEPPKAPRPDSDSPGLLEPIQPTIAPTSIILNLSALTLAARERQPVYYVPDEARPLDTAQVIRNSGRGCDASNWYDEEVDDAQQLDYSDDEQERVAKQRRNQKRHPHPRDADHQRPASRDPSRGGGTRPLPSAGQGGGGRDPARPPGFHHQHHPHVHRQHPGLGAPPPPPPPRRAQNGPGFPRSQPFPASALLHPHHPHAPYNHPQAPPPPLQYPIPSQPFPPYHVAPAPVIPPPPVRPPPPPPPPPRHDNGEDNDDTIYYDYS